MTFTMDIVPAYGQQKIIVSIVIALDEAHTVCFRVMETVISTGPKRRPCIEFVDQFP